MKTAQRCSRAGWNWMMVVLILLTIPLAAFAQDEKAAVSDHKVLQQRIDFGNAQILGQSIKSGAVYLMHRKKSDIKNMIEVRENYRKEIKEDYGLEKTAITQQSSARAEAAPDAKAPEAR